MSKIELVIATTNKGKLREISELLTDFPFKIVSLADRFNPIPVIEETGTTFEENARLKAKYVYEKLGGPWVLADDSGLEVDALSGAPGVHSARFAGPSATDNDNVKKLLSVLSNVPPPMRTARFKCSLVLYLGNGAVLTSEGRVEGTIGMAPEGNDGFGYDPLFTPQGFSATFAQIDPAVKNAISHRGKALINLRKELIRHYGGTTFN